MGNSPSNNYISVEDLPDTTLVWPNDINISKNIPPINPFHTKGKPYGTILDVKLKSDHPYNWAYDPIYDLRTGNKSQWGLNAQTYGNELNFQFLRLSSDNKTEAKCDLKYSSESNIYTTILKGCGNNGVKIRFELFADNIHCQRINNLKLTKKFDIWGFLKFDNQDKIPIAL